MGLFFIIFREIVTSTEMFSFGSDGANADPQKQLFVRMNGLSSLQLPSLHVLRLLFQRFGNVVKITSSKDGRSAFVTFATPEQAQAAKKAMNDHDGFNESNGLNLVQTLFVDFAKERGAKPTPVEAPRPSSAPRPAHLEAPKPAPAPRPAHLESPKPALVEDPKPTPVEAPRPSSAPRPAHLEAPKPAQEEASKPVLIVESVALQMVYIYQRQNPKIMSKPALTLLFDLRSSPKTKFQGNIPVQMFGNKDEWVIPHPNHPTATQNCQKAFKSGIYTEKLTVNIPEGVLESKNFWRD
jgi:hypothetical protein